MMRITCALINEAVSEYFSVPLSDIKSGRRTKPVMGARHTACWLARKMTRKSYVEIGLHLGGRDHATVINACERVERLRQILPDVERELAELEGIINIAAGAITKLNFDIPQDVDVKLVARRLITQPLTQFTLSIEELRAMATSILMQIEPEPAPEPQVITVTVDPDEALRKAAKAACAAHLTFESDRFGRGYQSAVEHLNGAVNHLRTTLKQEMRTS